MWLAPPLSGGIKHVRLQGETVLFGAGSYLASAGDVDVKVRWGGLRAILAREGVFFIEASGVGDLWITSYGAIEELPCDGTLVVDSEAPRRVRRVARAHDQEPWRRAHGPHGLWRRRGASSRAAAAC